MVGGLIVAVAVAWGAVAIRQHFTSGPDAQASAGMYAFGDFVFGMTVFSGLAIVPVALGLYWLRSVPSFWTALTVGAVLFTGTGLLALLEMTGNKISTGGWLPLLSVVRIGLMPLSACACLLCAAFAPEKRHRWLLAGAGVVDGLLFAGIVLAKLLFTSGG